MQSTSGSNHFTRSLYTVSTSSDPTTTTALHFAKTYPILPQPLSTLQTLEDTDSKAPDSFDSASCYVTDTSPRGPCYGHLRHAPGVGVTYERRRVSAALHAGTACVIARGRFRIQWTPCGRGSYLEPAATGDRFTQTPFHCPRLDGTQRRFTSRLQAGGRANFP